MSNAIKLAILERGLSAQLETRPEALGQVQVVWQGERLEDLEADAEKLAPHVVVVDISQLGDDPANAVDRIRARSGADLVFVVYGFAKREVLASLQERDGTRPLQGPVSLETLRGQMTGLIVRSILGRSDQDESTEPTPRRAVSAGGDLRRHLVDAPTNETPPRVTPRPESPFTRTEPAKVGALDPAPRFNTTQLGRLMQIKSVVECECPNHLAGILLRLTAFEAYAAGCASRNEQDAAIHEMLRVKTAAARVIIEEGLAELVAFEGITL